ncbi:sterol regulatory element-binding protein cleavage-activating protein-like, partial [Stylophora pistillata]|uniref:sterol regulatory element-binding protein cleavage-activating protein-like n=1 Tax=Stylophora pistillata TaxID=50429 RepID=UPI000C056113
YILGLPIKQTGIFPSMKADGPNHVIQYGVTLVMSSHNSRYIVGLSKDLKKDFPLASANEKDENVNKDNIVHIYYKGEDRELLELAPLCVTYFIVFLYLAFSVGKIEMVKSKWGLAFSAVICVIASLIMASGLCSFFGLVTTLDSSEIFPYLVIVVGVENILVITKSVVSTPVDLEVKIRVAQGLSREGWYIVKNLLTEMIILCTGFFTFVPAVQEFCFFAMVCLLSDFFLQMVLFVTVLSIDIRRMELSDLQRQPVQVRQRSLSDGSHQAQTPPSPVPGSPQSAQRVQFFGLLPPLPQSSVNNQGDTPRKCPVFSRRLPKRLNFAYFWARTRIVQKACMVCFICYFVYILKSPGSESVDTSRDAQTSVNSDKYININDSWLDYKESKTRFLEGVDESGNLSGWKGNGKKRPGFSFKSPSVELWRGLYQRHWPQVLSYYNISLLGRYVTVLPHVHLGVNIDTDIFVTDLTMEGDPLSAGSQSFSSVDGTGKLHQSFDGAQETPPGNSAGGSVADEDIRDARYYHNALSCMVLGVVVMIILFFVCKFLNDLQVNPSSRQGRRGRGHQCDALVECVPITLRGHTQNVEHLKCTVSSIVSVCLSGQICVWDIATGDCLRVMNRRRSVYFETFTLNSFSKKKEFGGKKKNTAARHCFIRHHSHQILRAKIVRNVWNTLKRTYFEILVVKGSYKCFFFQTNNRQVISGAANGGVRVWDVISGECLQHLRGHVKSVTAVTCTAEHLLSVSLESVLCIWDRARGECLHRLKQFPDLCSNVVMMSRTLFITGGQGHISVWDVLTGRRVKTVLLGNDDTSVFVRFVNVCEHATVVCDFGKELKIVKFPAVMDKAK